MLTKPAARFLAATSLALAATLAGCSGGGSGGANFFVSTCTLGCSGGEGGAQINCGVVGIAENQEIALLFTSPVDPSSITKESFVVRDVVTNDSAAGTRFVDPTNPNRLIFRPKMTTGDNGETIFGFKTGRAYQVYLNGTAQKDPKPYVASSNGRENESRVACTVQATQGIVDTVPGKPGVSVFVTVQPPGGAQSQVEVVQGQVPGATDVKNVSSIVFLFDELMQIGSMFSPSTGIPLGIDVMLDVDGNVATTSDRSQIEGSFAFGFEQTAQTTSVSFTPSGGFPSLGADVDDPRLVVVVLSGSIQDIAGNGLESPGTYSFVPQQIFFPAVTLPSGGEQFTDQGNLDAPVSGSPWGTEVAGRLTPGEGGGSGRHGALHVAAGETVVLHSSATKASGEITFTSTPLNGDAIALAGVVFTFQTTPGANPLHVPIRYSTSYTVASFVDVVRAYAAANPSSPMATASYSQSALTAVRVEALSAGIPSPPFPLVVQPLGSSPVFATASSGTLAGGFVSHKFSDPDIVTNFDFGAGTGTPGGTPPDLVVADGVFEFSSVEIEPTGTLVLAGTNPVRMLVRGDFVLADLARVDLHGQNRPPHNSATPYGQPGGLPGPGAGAGGKGGDRSNQPAAADAFAKGISLASPFLDGGEGLGVGGVAGLGQGLGGVRYPAVFPVTPTTYNEWTRNEGDNLCTSGQMANTGSGGAYARDGVRGQTKVIVANGVNQGGTLVSNLPPGNTQGGEFDDIGMEGPSANPTAERLLSPALGHLRGGSGGGGAGAHVGSTQTDVLSAQCFTNPFGFFIFTDNSGGGGGGGGGAVQVQAGGRLSLTGQIDAGGGSGGSAAGGALLEGTLAAPGGGGSGGAVLLQGGTLELAQQPSRVMINGGPGGVGGYAQAKSTAGSGSPGIARVEQRGTAPVATVVAAATFPTDPLDPTSVTWLSTGEWVHDVAKTDAFESVTGSQSCWMQVPGPHFSLTFQDDPDAPAPPADMGWNMDVILDLGAGEVTVPWRGSDGLGPFAGSYPEEHWGTLLNRDLALGEVAAPIVVRFQGARAKSVLNFPCDVDPNDPNGPLLIGSLTGWVRQPRELNDFQPLPTVARFLILFDRSHPDFDMIRGITNLRIEAQPE